MLRVKDSVYDSFEDKQEKRQENLRREEIGKQKELREHLPALLIQGRE
jgi:hypothetical protein